MDRNSYWLWVLLSTALLLFWPSFIYAESYGVPFRVHGKLFPSELILMLGHLAAGLLLWLLWTRKHKLLLSDVLLAVAACEGLSLLILIGTIRPYSRAILLGTIVISMTCYVAVYVTSQVRRPAISMVGLSLLALAAVGTVGAALLRPISEEGPREAGGREASFVESAFYRLEMIEFDDRIPRPAARGGGMEVVNDGVLLVTGDGKFFMAKLDDSYSALETRELNLQAPLNREDFFADAPESVAREFFGVADLLVQRTDDLNRIFTSHHYWNRESQCYVLRVSKTEWRLNEIDPVHEGDAWETVFETNPCIRFDGDSLRVHQLMMSGGRMKLLNDRELLLTVGDHGFDNPVYGPLFGQTAEVSYGKILRVRIDDGSVETYTTGHRNPQGLLITSSGIVWSTEHGPRGGDELNRIIEGRNYGWPFVTFGTDYHMHEYPIPDAPISQDSFYSPVYSWVPSVGISSLIESQSPVFSSWNGDLLIASLRGRTLFRVQTEDERVVVVEPVPIGGRIRDVVEDSHGHLILWMDAGSFIVLRPANEDRSGSSLFNTHCASCHDIDDDGRHSLGPDLAGIYNDPIGGKPDFRYSAALQEVEGRWDEETLRKFLADPGGFSPGTTMNFDGLGREQDVEQIVDYLSSLEE